METLNISDLIGVPYKENGRSKDEGFDCYGLAIEVERRLGKTLQDVMYDNHDLQLAEQNAPTLNVKKKDSYDILNVGDCLEIEFMNELHIGVVISSKEFIHATYNQGVRISRLTYYKIRNVYEVI